MQGLDGGGGVPAGGAVVQQHEYGAAQARLLLAVRTQLSPSFALLL